MNRPSEPQGAEVAEKLVDAVLVGLDAVELVTISGLNETEGWIARDGKVIFLNAGLPFGGNRLTRFATGEKQPVECPGGLGGNVQYYPVNAPAEAGFYVETIDKWHRNVLGYCELITS